MSTVDTAVLLAHRVDAAVVTADLLGTAAAVGRARVTLVTLPAYTVMIASAYLSHSLVVLWNGASIFLYVPVGFRSIL